MVHSYYDREKYQKAIQVAQDEATRLQDRMVVGYCSYAGWTHYPARDTLAVAELTEITLVEPERQET